MVIEIRKSDFIRYHGYWPAQNSNEARYKMRAIQTALIEKLHAHAGFIILDMWYPDAGIKTIDNNLIKALRKTNNVTLLRGGYDKNRLENTLAVFNSSIKVPGHAFMQHKNGYLEFNAFILYARNKEAYFFVPSVAVLAVNHVGYNRPSNRYIGRIKNRNIKNFPIVSATDILKNWQPIKKNYVVIISKVKPTDDTWHVPGFGFISGSELICNEIKHLEQSLKKN